MPKIDEKVGRAPHLGSCGNRGINMLAVARNKLVDIQMGACRSIHAENAYRIERRSPEVPMTSAIAASPSG